MWHCYNIPQKKIKWNWKIEILIYLKLALNFHDRPSTTLFISSSRCWIFYNTRLTCKAGLQTYNRLLLFYYLTNEFFTKLTEPIERPCLTDQSKLTNDNLNNATWAFKPITSRKNWPITFTNQSRNLILDNDFRQHSLAIFGSTTISMITLNGWLFSLLKEKCY